MISNKLQRQLLHNFLVVRVILSVLYGNPRFCAFALNFAFLLLYHLAFVALQLLLCSVAFVKSHNDFSHTWLRNCLWNVEHPHKDFASSLMFAICNACVAEIELLPQIRPWESEKRKPVTRVSPYGQFYHGYTFRWTNACVKWLLQSNPLLLLGRKPAVKTNHSLLSGFRLHF